MNGDVKKIFDWWARLQPNKMDDRATLAKLRRAGSIVQLCMLPETMSLCGLLETTKQELAKPALIAGILATVRVHATETFATQLGCPRERPKMSPLRFQRLIEAQTPDEQLTAFRRAVLQNGRTGNIHDLAGSLLNWSDDRRQSWLYDYYQTRNPKPEMDAAT